MDRRILEAVVHRFAGGPVGLTSLAATVGEEPDTLEEVHEPYLVQQGLLQRTRLGRAATAGTYRVLGLDPSGRPVIRVPAPTRPERRSPGSSRTAPTSIPDSPSSPPEPVDAPAWLAPFHYDLRDEQIARRPAEPRDASRLLVLDRGDRRAHADHLSKPAAVSGPGDLLVLNETRVVAGAPTDAAGTHRPGRSRCCFRIPRGRRDRHARGRVALLGPGDRRASERRPALAGQDLDPGPARSCSTNAPGAGSGGSGRSAEAWSSSWTRPATFRFPLTLHREDHAHDRSWYQTVFAREEGAVAAPTAGLHFTRVASGRDSSPRGVGLARVVLHVGPGTFLPVRAEDARGTSVLPERYSRFRPRRPRRPGGRGRAAAADRGRNDHGAGARDGGDEAAADPKCATPADRRASTGPSGRHRLDRSHHPPRASVPGGRRPDHELPPSALEPSAPGLRPSPAGSAPRRPTPRRGTRAFASTAMATPC